MIAGATLEEARRQRLIATLIAAALVMIGCGRALQTIDFAGNPQKLVVDFGFAAISLFGAALVIASVVQLYLVEIESGAAAAIVAKPVARSEYVVGKWIAVCTIAGLFCLVSVSVVAVLVWQASGSAPLPILTAELAPAVVELRGVLGAAVLQLVKLALLAAVTVAVASYARSVGLCVMVAVVATIAGHLRLMIDEWFDAAGTGGIGRVAAWLIHVVPDLQVFEVSDRVARGELAVVTWPLLGAVSAYAAAYVLAAGMVAVVQFRQRDL
ncbi:MAG TPA: hypothetical protein VHF69_03055 [Candidatus Synoicihabitans sp.]|nr:hypothetical protein [Candidatus Synoicihabitans sp.]